MENFDLVVIGGGPGGYVGAIRAAQLGMKVACVEKRKGYGGTCLNVGCIPSKALLESSEHYYHTKNKLAKHGVLVDNVRMDVAAMLKRKDAVVRQNVNGIAGLLKKNKIEAVNGIGKITQVQGDLKTVEVTSEAGNRTLQARNVMIATGSTPVELPFLKFDGKRVLSSTEALELKEVPKHLVVVGGGVIGLELGSVWMRLGARVTVVEFLDRILPPVDRQISQELFKVLQKQGMEFRLAHKCLGAKPDGTNGLVVEIEELASGTKSALECDYVLVATGRRPYTDGLGLQELGIETDKAGRVVIDSHFQTKISGIYAVGDVVVGPMLAHKAEEDGIACVETMAGQHGHVNYDTLPNVVYTWPEIATVGLNEEELKAKNIEFKVGTFPFMANGRARTMEETDGLVKIIADAKTDRVLGVHIVGPRASDLIPEAVSVMEFGGSAEDIARTCHAHPTLSETVKEAAMAVAKRQIHL
ncbi:dihydrolipoyl dehydrogenase [Bdellovibrionota bacterium FG-1]